MKTHNTIMKTILKEKVERKIARGQPHILVDNVKRWTGLNLAKCTVKTRNRASWKAIADKLLKQEVQDDETWLII